MPVAAPDSVPEAHTEVRRERWVDVTRGVGITLVVYAHAVRGLFGAGILHRAGAWHFADRFIYAFHMPLFFFLSGLFLRARDEDSALQIVRRHVVRLGYVYLLWASAQISLQIVMARHTNSTASWSMLGTIFTVPPMQFWFLYALLLQSLWLGLLDKARLDRRINLALALVAFVTAPFVSIGHWVVVHHARHFLPYTAYGLYVGIAKLSERLRRLGRSLLLASVLGFAIVALAVATTPGPFGQLSGFPIAVAGVIAATCLSALWSRASAGAGHRAAAVLAELGRSSLAIYVAHTIISAAVRIALQQLLHDEEPISHLVLGTVLGLLVPVLLLRASKRLSFPYLFEWPAARRPRIAPGPDPCAPAPGLPSPAVVAGTEGATVAPTAPNQ